MKEAKKKSSLRKDVSYQKPALQSDAFTRALKEAKLRIAGSGRLRSLFERAAQKASSLPRHRFKANWPYLQTMLRLVRAYERGEYKQVSHDDLTWIVAALNYLVDSFDLIPDQIPLLGFVDDATVVGFVADKTRQMLDDFMIWETNAAASPPSSSERSDERQTLITARFARGRRGRKGSVTLHAIGMLNRRKQSQRSFCRFALALFVIFCFHFGSAGQ